MKKYYFKAIHAYNTVWFGPYEALNVHRAWRAHLERQGIDFYPWNRGAARRYTYKVSTK